MPYTSYLDTTQHHEAAGRPHVACDVRLYLIMMWGSVSKTRKKETTYIKNLIKEFNLLFPPIAT
jgi:hypothetical protein